MLALNDDVTKEYFDKIF